MTTQPQPFPHYVYLLWIKLVEVLHHHLSQDIWPSCECRVLLAGNCIGFHDSAFEQTKTPRFQQLSTFLGTKGTIGFWISSLANETPRRRRRRLQARFQLQLDTTETRSTLTSPYDRAGSSKQWAIIRLLINVPHVSHSSENSNDGSPRRGHLLCGQAVHKLSADPD